MAKLLRRWWPRYRAAAKWIDKDGDERGVFHEIGGVVCIRRRMRGDWELFMVKRTFFEAERDAKDLDRMSYDNALARSETLRKRREAKKKGRWHG